MENVIRRKMWMRSWWKMIPHQQFQIHFRMIHFLAMDNKLAAITTFSEMTIHFSNQWKWWISLFQKWSFICRRCLLLVISKTKCKTIWKKWKVICTMLAVATATAKTTNFHHQVFMIRNLKTKTETTKAIMECPHKRLSVTTESAKQWNAKMENVKSSATKANKNKKLCLRHSQENHWHHNRIKNKISWNQLETHKISIHQKWNGHQKQIKIQHFWKLQDQKWQNLRCFIQIRLI